MSKYNNFQLYMAAYLQTTIRRQTSVDLSFIKLSDTPLSVEGGDSDGIFVVAQGIHDGLYGQPPLSEAGLNDLLRGGQS